MFRTAHHVNVESLAFHRSVALVSLPDMADRAGLTTTKVEVSNRFIVFLRVHVCSHLFSFRELV